MRFGNQDGSGNHQVLRKYSGGGSGNLAGENGEIERAGFFQAAGGRGEAKAAGKRGFRESVLHRRRGHGVSAMLTEGTSGPPRKWRCVRGRVFPREFAPVVQLGCSWGYSFFGAWQVGA